VVSLQAREQAITALGHTPALLEEVQLAMELRQEYNLEVSCFTVLFEK
jgi:hypothetical protein